MLAYWLLVITLLPAARMLCSISPNQQNATSTTAATTTTTLTAPTTSGNSTVNATNTTITVTTNNSTLEVQPPRPPNSDQQEDSNQNNNEQQQPPRRQQQAEDEYLVGVGIADITGPAADINLVSLLQQLLVGASPPTASASTATNSVPPRTYGGGGGGSASIANNVVRLQYPSWQEFRNMGYAKPNQDAGGIHLRQFCRSIIVRDTQVGNLILYISIDNGMVSQLLRSQVLKRLTQKYGAQVYNENNVMMTATHSHSCPGGFFQYWLYNIPSAGFIPQTLEALIEGIVRSVDRAHASQTRGKIYFNQGDLLGASINRSPTAYVSNPMEERAQYEHDTDKTMTLLRLVDLNGQPLAMISWFPVHGTSMNNSNRLISSDNKGYASLLFEQEYNPPGTLPGKGKFVAIFAQANEGDVSPNTLGPRCANSGLPCDDATSTCGAQMDQVNRWRRAETNKLAKSERRMGFFGKLSSFVAGKRKDEFSSRSGNSNSANDQVPQTQGTNTKAGGQNSNEKCVAAGPGKDMFGSTKIIAYRQYFKARQLFTDKNNLRPVSGPVRFIHEHIDMAQQVVPIYKSAVELATRTKRIKRQAQSLAPSSGKYFRTCPAALGYSFAAGTIDGSGAFNFQQGDTASTPYWNMVRDLLRRPSTDQVRCQEPKPILVSTGEMDFPYMWHPRVVPTQIIAIGQVAIVGLPGEFTTMAGRRVRDAVQLVLDNQSSNEDPSQGRLNQEGSQEDILLEDDTRPNRNRTSVNYPRRRRQARQEKFKVILSGLSNTYTSYVTTIEEYHAQRYEGASTLYGPHTLQAYTNQFKRLAQHLTNLGQFTPLQLQPPDLTKSLFSLKAGVFFDGTPSGMRFGQTIIDVDTNQPHSCGETVSATFVAANPRNDLRQEGSFLYVDKYMGDGSWAPIASDASWETKYIWERTNTFKGESRATIQWDIPTYCDSGIYRFRHFGSAKGVLQSIQQYSGQSSPFIVVAKK